MMCVTRALLAVLIALGPVCLATADSIDDVVRELNSQGNVKATRDQKSYPILWDAYLDLTPPPVPISEDGLIYFNVHPKMANWNQASSWAESNQGMAAAIIEAEEKTLFGLPYGLDALDDKYVQAGLYAQIGRDGSLRGSEMRYQRAIETMATFATVEAYRRLEAGQTQEGLDLAIAMIFVARQCCDRDMMDEVFYSIPLTSWLLGNLRDMMWLYQDDITHEQYGQIANERLPRLRPDRARLLMPEGDRIVSLALLKEVFDSDGQPDEEKFADTFASIQAEEKPLTRMGAARRWLMIAPLHDSYEDSENRLNLIYDDWFRRWRVQEYDPILAYETQFERTNQVRYAAVVYSMQDMQALFEYRNELLAAVYGTSVSAGLAGYRKQLGQYPRDIEATYGTFVRKRDNRDPFEVNFEPFKYRVLSSALTVDTPQGRLSIPSGTGLLYSRGIDLEDNRGQEHTRDGGSGDLILWPPIQALEREAGLVP